MTFAATRNKGFTLIELLVIVAIISTMVTVSVVNIRSGQATARIKGATRDIVASIRHARSTALVMMQPTVVTYSTTRVDESVCAKIELNGAKINSSGCGTYETLSGEAVKEPHGAKSHALLTESDEDDVTQLKEGEGRTVEDVLFAPISEEVVRGVRLKVTMGDEKLEFEQEEEPARRNRISVFSNVDFLLGKFNEQKEKEAAEKAEAEAESASEPAEEEPDQEPVSVVWEANGRCDPHKVWVYPDGAAPDKGLCIKVDRFGAVKVLSGEDDDE